MTDNHTSTKVAAVTGATGAIGKAIAHQLAQFGYQVYLLARNQSKAVDTVQTIQDQTGNQDVNYLLVDLSRKASVLEIAQNWQGPLHILINNAAISPPERQLTPEGIEVQFATNVLGYYWTTTQLADILGRSSPSRIVNVASYWAGNLDLTDLEFKRRKYHNHDAYRQSKQANRMLTPILAQRYLKNGITVNACHPGDVNSALSNSLGFGGSQSPDDGAKTPVWLATSPEVNDVTGKYFEDCKEVVCRFGSDLEGAEKLLEICQSY